MSAKVHTYDAATGVTMSAINRCDRCGAQAYYEARLPGDAVLLFCAHHAGQHHDKLLETAIEIHDHRGLLEAQAKEPEPTGR